MDKLEQIVDESGFSKNEIAKRVGVSRQTLYNWLDNSSNLNPRNVRRILTAIRYNPIENNLEHQGSKSVEFNTLSNAELIQLARENSMKINALEDRIKSLEIKLIQLMLR